MKPRLIILVALLLLGFPALAVANKAYRVFEGDPDYPQLALQHGMITFSCCMAAVLGLLLVVRKRGQSRIAGIVFFLIGVAGLWFYFRSNTFTHWWVGSRPPNLPRSGPGVSTTILTPVSYPPATVGIIMAFVITVAGLLMSLWIRVKGTKSTPQIDAKTAPLDTPEASQQTH